MSTLIGTARTLVIGRVDPELGEPDWPLKRVVGDDLWVRADIVGEGNGLIDAALLLRAESEVGWVEAPMRLIDNDRWAGRIRLERNARHRYTIEAWPDLAGTWHAGLTARLTAGADVALDVAEGMALLAAAAERDPDGPDGGLLRRGVEAAAALADPLARATLLADEALRDAARRHPDRSNATRYRHELALMVDRPLARFGAWYELFPRSQGRDPAKPRATTLREAEWRLPDIAAMGFDVVYLPPIHPIGTTGRKGPDNAEAARPGDPGSPWAIGSSEGGHEAVAPELGGLPGFEHFRDAVESHGMQLALDLALQASPDHPWVRQHPEWFRRTPDGSIRTAENPPKRYQDIYPFDFHVADPSVRAALWAAWLEIVQLWVRRGVRAFRVDNPHTKPIAFWTWLIGEVQREDPEVVFLSEAFTRPRLMQALAAAGFSQSYTYFTWRESAAELGDYAVELATPPISDVLRPSMWPNTPDIFPHHLDPGRPWFEARAVLAATLSPAWGIYSGYELCEVGRLDDREEYARSEKYEIRARDWEAPGNIKPLIGALNRLRHDHPALQRSDTLRLQPVTGSQTLFYRRALPDGEPDPLNGEPPGWRDALFVAVNCHPSQPEQAILHPDLPAIGIGWDEPFRFIDLRTGEQRTERGADLAVTLDADQPFRIFRIEPVGG